MFPDTASGFDQISELEGISFQVRSANDSSINVKEY